MRLVERHIVKDNRFEDICLKSGLLYNYVLFNVRQGIFSRDYINEYEFSTKFGRKVFGDSYISGIIDSGLAFNPVRVNIL